MSLFAQRAQVKLQAFERKGGFERLESVAREMPFRQHFLQQHFRQAQNLMIEARGAVHFYLGGISVEEGLKVASPGKKGAVAPKFHQFMNYMRPEPKLGQDAFRPESVSLLMESTTMTFLRRPYPVLFSNFERLHEKYFKETGDVFRYESDAFDRVGIFSTLLSFALQKKWLEAPPHDYFEPIAIPFDGGLLAGRAYRRPAEELSYAPGSFVSMMLPSLPRSHQKPRFVFNTNLSPQITTEAVVSIGRFIAPRNMTANERALERSARDLIKSLFTSGAESILSLRYRQDD